jgi:hypothetical protein
MRLLLLITLLFVSLCHLHGQDTGPIKIYGTVTEASGDKPISHASVYIKNHDHVGVYTNPDGAFLLAIPRYADEDVLIISSIGFEPQELPITGLRSGNNIRIALKPMTIMLHEVIVHDTRLFDLEKICLTAVQRISANYPMKQHSITSFYRKVSTDSTKFTGLIEAQLGIHDKGYKTDTKELQIQALQTRHGDNTIVWDSLLLKMGQKMKLDFNSSAFQSLHRLYESNLIRLYKNPNSFFNLEAGLFSDKLKKTGVKTDIRLADISLVDDDTILHIDYRWLAPNDQLLDAIQMAINLRDHAIVEYTRGIFGEQVHVTFKKQADGRYYPVYIKRVTPVIYDKAKYKRYYNIETLEIEEIDLKGSKKLNPASLENRAVEFDATRHAYDPIFWNNYSRNHPLEPSILKSLEERTPLKQQFQHNKR